MSAALLREYTQYLNDIAFKEDASPGELLTIILAWAVFWFVVFSIATPVFRSMTYGKPWLRKMCEREYDGNPDGYDDWFKGMTKEQIVHKLMWGWATTQVIMVQHVVGSALCVPAVLRIGEPSWASSLAIQGLFCEMGWEVGHMMEMLCTRFLTKDGEKKITSGELLFNAIHHGLTTTLGLPMGMHYRGLRALHWLIFELQLAGATAPLIEYGKTLDIKKPDDLRKFKMVNLFMLVFFVWTRFLHFCYLVISIVLTWYHDKAWGIMALGTLPLLAFCFLNYMFVSGTYKRYMKFRKASAEVDSLPAGATEMQMRKSIANLEQAAASLLDVDVFDPADVVASFLESLEDRPTIERRKSMPPVRKGRKSRLLQFASAPADVWKEE